MRARDAGRPRSVSNGLSDAGVAVMRNMRREVADSPGLEVNFHRVTECLREEENLLAAVRKVGALTEGRQLREERRETPLDLVGMIPQTPQIGVAGEFVAAL